MRYFKTLGTITDRNPFCNPDPDPDPGPNPDPNPPLAASSRSPVS